MAGRVLNPSGKDEELRRVFNKVRPRVMTRNGFGILGFMIEPGKKFPCNFPACRARTL